jgi:hypothetical protein
MQHKFFNKVEILQLCAKGAEEFLCILLQFV